ncbi:MAG: signal peptidase I [Gemmataceae bacterium]
MAPTLLGNHWSVPCRECGYVLRLGEKPDPTKRSLDGSLCHDCPRCQGEHLDWSQLREVTGDRVLVQKTAYLFCSPRRWDVVVFRMFGILFIKRIVGLPEETVEIRNGDLWINGKLIRKSFSQRMRLRRCLFDSSGLAPKTGHWKLSEGASLVSVGQGHALRLKGHNSKTSTASLCPNFFSAGQKYFPITNEYVYNRQRVSGRERVHDFSLECDVVVKATGRGRKGRVLFGIHDGADYVLVSVGAHERVDRSKHTPCVVRLFPNQDNQTAHRGCLLLSTKASRRSTHEVSLPPSKRSDAIFFRTGTCYHVHLALVDRHFSLRVDNEFWETDLRAKLSRNAVTCPIEFGVENANVTIRNVRLYRDVHYTQDGQNGVRRRGVRLGPNQYFVLGDNSPISEDSRHWSKDGIVDAKQIIGQVLLLGNQR